MISATGVVRYCDAMHAAGAVYVWGADGQIITGELLEQLKKTFGTSNYAKVNLLNVEGRIGADCSGFLTPISGLNMTAAAHYKACKVRGVIDKMPTDKVCLIFRAEGGSIVHVAVYTGDGKLTEMWDGCEQREFKASQWTYYGMPDWIEEQPDKVNVAQLKHGDTVNVKQALKGFTTALGAISGKNPRTTVQPGMYYVYKVADGAVNLSRSKTSPGSWVVL